jgi:hypothetical protein
MKHITMSATIAFTLFIFLNSAEAGKPRDQRKRETVSESTSSPASQERIQKLADTAAEDWVNGNYPKCGEHRYQILADGERTCLVRFDKVSWKVRITEIEVAEGMRYGRQREIFGDKLTFGKAEIDLQRSGKSGRRCVSSERFPLHPQYVGRSYRLTGERSDTVKMDYRSDKMGESWSIGGASEWNPPSCETILRHWNQK